MLARTLLDAHYRDFERLTLDVADALAAQARAVRCACVQVDEANIPGNPADGPLAAEAINRVLDAVGAEKAVHFCFGNYGGQTIQPGGWDPLLSFLNSLRADHLVLELAHRPAADLQALRELDRRLGVGVGVVDIKVNHVETPEEVAAALRTAEETLGPGRVRYAHPDCGFWGLPLRADRSSGLVMGAILPREGACKNPDSGPYPDPSAELSAGLVTRTRVRAGIERKSFLFDNRSTRSSGSYLARIPLEPRY